MKTKGRKLSLLTKKLLLACFIAVFCFLLASCSKEEALPSGELEYVKTSSGDSYRVKGIGSYKGSTLVIPETYNNLPVVHIGSKAFKDNESIKKVILPSSLIQIYEGAFEGCSSLTTVECHSTKLDLVSPNVFKDTPFVKNKKNYEDGGLYIGNCLVNADPAIKDEMIIKEGTSLIAYKAFANCELRRVVIPKTLRHLGRYTFYQAKNLEEVIFNSTPSYLGEGLFYECTSLKSISLPSSCKKINARVFFGCTSLENISFSKVQEIKHAAFSGCIALKKIDCHNAVKLIEDEAFLGCSSLSSVSGLSSLKTLGAKAFRDCSTLTNCVLPSTASIGAFAFDGTPLETQE